LSGDDFDKVFGSNLQPPSFAQRVAKPDAAVPANGETSAGSGPYKPYGFLPTGNVGETCDVQRWLEKTEIAEGIEFQYRFLMQIGYVGEEQLRLFLPDCIVVIEGMYLRDLRKKLARRQVTFIQQYSEKVWPTPPPKGEPLIDKIEVVRPDPVATVRGRNS
jgi:hypothetical protein